MVGIYNPELLRALAEPTRWTVVGPAPEPSDTESLPVEDPEVTVEDAPEAAPDDEADEGHVEPEDE